MKAGNRMFKGKGEIRMNGNYEAAQEKIEKNKAFRKRLKNFYIGLYGLLGAMLLWGCGLGAFGDSKIAVVIGVGVLAALFVAWILWCVLGIPRICCPHCNKFIGRSNPWNIAKCPYCGTSLEIIEYFEREKV